MTREEAIMQIESLKNYCEYMADSDENGAYVFDLDEQALDLALAALRPVSRELVEEVWPGCPYCKEDGEGYVKKFGAYSILDGEVTTGHCKPQKIKFCPHCSRPLTDEAVEMVVERLESLYE